MRVRTSERDDEKPAGANGREGKRDRKRDRDREEEERRKHADATETRRVLTHVLSASTTF